MTARRLQLAALGCLQNRPNNNLVHCYSALTLLEVLTIN